MVKEIDDQYFVDLYGEVINESDRAVVILFAAELDSILAEILEKYLLPKSSKDVVDLLSPSCFTGTFAGHIELAYRLGIIPKTVADDLHVIRKIRNFVAHGTHKSSIKSNKVNQLLQKTGLTQLKDANGAFLLELDFDNPRKAFQGLSCWLFGHLQNIQSSSRTKNVSGILKG